MDNTMASKRTARRNCGDIIGNAVIYLLIGIFAVFCLIPMVLVLSVSLTAESSILANGYSLIPGEFSLYAYRMLFTGSANIYRSYAVTIFVTAVGTTIAVLITAMGAYTLANKNVRYRNHLSFFFFFTMLFSAGIVPWYMMCRSLGLTDNLLALIVPGLLFNAFNLFLVRNFMAGLPVSLMESARIDGAGDITIAFRIFFPLSIPVLAAITLFYAVAYWNDWWNAIMLVDNKNLFPLQYLLFRLQSEIQMLRDLQGRGGIVLDMRPPTESIKMATVIVTIGPIILLYPFLQKYFVKGLVIGAIKG